MKLKQQTKGRFPFPEFKHGVTPSSYQKMRLHSQTQAESHSRNYKGYTDNPMENLEKKGKHHNVI